MRGGGAPAKKLKDFKGTIAKLFRLLKDLSYFKLVVVNSLILAAASTAIISIVAPNRLSS